MGRTRLRLTALPASIATLVASAFVVPTVQADTYGGPRDSGRHCDTSELSQCIANSWSHLVYYDDLGDADLIAATEAALAYYNSIGTDVTLFESTSITGNDVKVQDASYGL